MNSWQPHRDRQAVTASDMRHALTWLGHLLAMVALIGLINGIKNVGNRNWISAAMDAFAATVFAAGAITSERRASRYQEDA